MRTSPRSMLVIGFLALLAITAQADFHYRLRVNEQPSREAALDELRRQAVISAVEELMGKRTGEPRADQLERRLLIRASRARDVLVSFATPPEAQQHSIQGWWALASVDVNAARLKEIRDKLATELQQPGHRVLVAISEEIHIDQSPWPLLAIQQQKGSLLQRRIENRLIEEGFEVVSGAQLDRLREKGVRFSELNGDDERVITGIALNQNAEIVILGHAVVSGPRVNHTALAAAGRQLYFWHSLPQIEVTWVDNARKISVPIPKRTEGGSQFANAASARAALDQIGDELAGLISDSLVTNLPATGEAREVTITIVNATFAQSRRVMERLAALPDITLGRQRQANEGLEVRIRTARDTFGLAADISEFGFGGEFRLDVRENGPNTVMIRLKN